jgi:hypothetical protein
MLLQLWAWVVLNTLLVKNYQGYGKMDYNSNIQAFLALCQQQKSFVLKTWLVEHAWVNPSMIFHPEEADKIIMVWRVPNRVSSGHTFSPLQNDFFVLLISKNTTRLVTFGLTQARGKALGKKIGLVRPSFFWQILIAVTHSALQSYTK